MEVNHLKPFKFRKLCEMPVKSGVIRRYWGRVYPLG
jgi:hypothetical protein